MAESCYKTFISWKRRDVPGMTGPPNSFTARSPVTLTTILFTSCVKTTLALITKKLGCLEIETNISSAYENYAIFNRRKLVVVLELLHLRMKVTVSEPCDVIRVGAMAELLWNIPHLRSIAYLYKL